MCIMSPICESVHYILYQNIDNENGAEFSLLSPTNPSSKSEQNKFFKDMAIYQCAVKS